MYSLFTEVQAVESAVYVLFGRHEALGGCHLVYRVYIHSVFIYSYS